MKKIGFNNDFILNDLIILDENFVKKYLPSADENFVKVYLYGIYLAKSNINTDFIDTISDNLKLPIATVISAINYWENLGLIDQKGVDLYVFNSAKNPIKKAIKYDASKYKDFTQTVNNNYPQLDIKYNQYNLLYEFMEEEKFSTDSMLLIIQHCSNDTNYKFNVNSILALAKICVNEDRKKPNQVGDKLKEIEAQTGSLIELFSTLNIKSRPDTKDKEMYDKWISFGYTLNTILIVARSLKKGSMEKLDDMIETLKNANAFTAFEISEYLDRYQETRKLAIYVSKKLSDFVEVELAIKEYLDRWFGLGFSLDSIKLIVDLCFKRGIKGYQTANNLIDGLFDNGIFSDENVKEYVSNQTKIDSNIVKIKNTVGAIPNITEQDRNIYSNWLTWGFNEATILKTSKLFTGVAYPINKMNTAFVEIKNKGEQQNEDAIFKSINSFIGNKKNVNSKSNEFSKHELSEDDFNNAVADLDAILNDFKKDKKED